MTLHRFSQSYELHILCYISSFVFIGMSYKVLVVGEGKYFGLSTACLYVNVGGENGESGIVEIPRGTYSVDFTVS